MIVVHGETLWSPAPQPMDDDDNDDELQIDLSLILDRPPKDLTVHMVQNKSTFKCF